MPVLNSFSSCLLFFLPSFLTFRFALKLRTDIEPYLSIFYSNEQQRLADMGASEAQEKAEMWDVEEIEREKEEEEYRWVVATATVCNLSYPIPSCPAQSCHVMSFDVMSCPREPRSLSGFPLCCLLPPRCASLMATL